MLDDALYSKIGEFQINWSLIGISLSGIFAWQVNVLKKHVFLNIEEKKIVTVLLNSNT